ncbi:HesB/YadR/YfhF family protein [Bacillus sp. REN3]|uniref:HesB/YadR/YfhF family protein n=1 Tax=Bacillus sp. REN3 TaxID=2802440 RepID=UPI001AEE08D3|nr:HesB/YadR/YfhF family protein [Bacillus sp. REN3]
MNITIHDDAAAWYENEMGLSKGGYMRFFARYGGFSTVQQGFSLGVSKEEPDHIGAKTEKNDVTYYIEEKDLWYFDGHDLIVDLHPVGKEPEFKYEKK